MELIINVSPDALSLSPGFSPLKLNPGNVMARPRFQREAGVKKCFAENFCEKTSAKTKAKEKVKANANAKAKANAKV